MFLKVTLAAVMLGLLVAPRAKAERAEFTRLVPSSSLTPRSLSAAYGAEAQRSLDVKEKNPASAGPAPGSEAERQYRGLSHRLSSFVGVVPELGVGVEAVFQTVDQETDLRLIVPELRIHGLDVGPVELGTYLAARIRRNGRRGPTGTLGLTVEHWSSRARLAGQLGFEYGPSGEPRAFGGRYSIAGGYSVNTWLLFGGEGWGQMSSLGSGFEQGHHAGPTVRFAPSDAAWISLNGPKH